MSTATDRIEPILRTDNADMDSATAVEVYDRHRLEISLRKLLEVNYNVHASRSRNHPSAPHEMRFKGSGYWSRHRDESGALVISFDVGCWCSHDCCGHLCSLSITVQMTDYYFIVITNKGFNY